MTEGTWQEVIEGRIRWSVDCGDALEFLVSLPDACADTVITDPPYCAGAISESQRTRANGQGLRSENLRKFGWFIGDNMGTAGLACLLRAVAYESRRVCKPTGSLLMFCDWRMLPMLVPAIESAGVRYQGLIVWDKGSMGLGSGFRNQHELVMHFTFGSPEYHDQSVSNVICSARVSSEDRLHQAQKPLELLRNMVKVCSPEDGVVLDPFVGSGSTLLAALTLGRRAIGNDGDPEHVDSARNRLHAATLDPLFDTIQQGSLFES